MKSKSSSALLTSTNSLGESSSTNSKLSSLDSKLMLVGGMTSIFSPKSFISAFFCFCSSSSFSRNFLNSSALFSASILRFSSFSLAIFCSLRVCEIDFSTKSKSFLRPKSLFLYQSVDHK